MKAGIYNPYLDTLGGGERYSTTFAKVLSGNGYQVDMEWKDPQIKKKIEDRFGVDLKEINIVDSIKKGDGYDICFWVSDGSIPLLHSRKNFLHFQVPFHHTGGNNLLNKMKFIRIDQIICNSFFTKKFIDKEFGVESIVIYPPVDTEKITPRRKQKIILSVGRFSELLQSKHQDILINVFKKMVDEGLKDWKFVLAGGADVGAGSYLDSLKQTSQGYPIEILESPSYKKLTELYGISKIFWTASGFDENEEEHPEKVEHFGITVVEAMSAGCIPLAFLAGGHKEIIEDGVDGYLWHNTQEIEAITKDIIEKPSDLAKKAILKSKKFTYEEFRKNIIKIL